MLAGFGKDTSRLVRVISVPLIGYGAGRGEFGRCLHLPFRDGYNIAVNPAQNSVYLIDVASLFSIWTNNAWDYRKEEVEEVSKVCSENPGTGGIIIYNQESIYGPKVQVFLDRTFGVKEISVGWKGGMALDESLIPKFGSWLKQRLGGHPGEDLESRATRPIPVTRPSSDIPGIPDDFLKRKN